MRGEPRAHTEVPEILCLIAIGGGDIEALLIAWDRDSRPISTAHIAAIVVDVKRSRQFGRSTDLGAFWSDAESDSARIISWLGRVETAERLAVARSTESEPKMQALYAEGEAAVRWLVQGADSTT